MKITCCCPTRTWWPAISPSPGEINPTLASLRCNSLPTLESGFIDWDPNQAGSSPGPKLHRIFMQSGRAQCSANLNPFEHIRPDSTSGYCKVFWLWVGGCGRWRCMDVAQLQLSSFRPPAKFNQKELLSESDSLHGKLLPVCYIRCLTIPLIERGPCGFITQLQSYSIFEPETT